MMFDFKFNFFWNATGLKEVLDNAAMKAAEQAAEYVAERARVYCPVDTGDLKASIKAVPSMNRRVWNVLATIPYAGYVEYGTLHGDVWIPPNPFFRRAMSDGRKRFPEILRESMVTTPHQLSQGMKLGTTIRVSA
jgi:hypothetical protein